MRDNVGYRIEHGRLVRPDRCDHCGTGDLPAGQPYFSVRDHSLPIGEVVASLDWLCRVCYYKRHPPRSQAGRRRFQNVSKLPPYAVMKHDYVVLGKSLSTMAKEYGACDASHVHRTLTDRAKRAGDHPLEQLRRQQYHKVRPDFIVELAFEYCRRRNVSAHTFHALLGLNKTMLYDYRSGKVKWMPRDRAVLILDAIGEPVPTWMRQKVA